MANATRRWTRMGVVASVPFAARAVMPAGQSQSLSANGASVFGRFMAARDPAAPLILLVDQTGSSKAEYGTMQPRLAAEGYASLAIDPRSGGSLLGARNETLAARGSADAGYDEADPDLEAALVWASATAPRRSRRSWHSRRQSARPVHP